MQTGMTSSTSSGNRGAGRSHQQRGRAWPAVLIGCAALLSACGLRRNLELPDKHKTDAQQTEQAVPSTVAAPPSVTLPKEPPPSPPVEMPQETH